MTYRDTCILLPCHSLEDFPMHHEGSDADGLLAAWTALWHPALLAQTGSAPSWYRGDSPPGDLSSLLILVPGVSEKELPTGFADRAQQEEATLIRGNLAREQILQQALAPLADLVGVLDQDLVADFLALGYAYLQVQLLTRQMRYSTNLDELHFNNLAVTGAKAAAAGNLTEARDQLTACFDLLAQERDHYYAVEAYIVDVTLLAPTTLGEPLRRQLEQEVPTNLLVTAELLEQMRHSAPDTLAALRAGVEAARVGLIGGDWTEGRVTLQSCETVRHQLLEGLTVFEHLAGARPTVYGRRRFGLSVLHPQLLGRLGYHGVLHTALGDGRYPEGSQLKIRWEGPDRQPIDAIGRTPLNAAQAGPFLALASKLGETMDMDHVATVCLAHWPGHVCSWYEDLRRTARYGAMLGKFVTVEEYFRETDYPGQTEQFHADQYTSPYLQQAVAEGQTDPITTVMRYWRQRGVAMSTAGLEVMSAAISGQTFADSTALLAQIDRQADGPAATDWDERTSQFEQQAAARLAELLPRRDTTSQPGYLVLNPTSHVRRTVVATPQLTDLPVVEKPVYATSAAGEPPQVVVDVPPMGFAWVTGLAQSSTTRRAARLLAVEQQLQNDYFEAVVNPQTGALQSLFEYEKRGNRLSQQLAVRCPQGWPELKRGQSPYSTMVADSVRITAATAILGEITASGRLVDPRGETLATFEQCFRAWRGSRVLQLKIQLDTRADLDPEPWKSYYCCRFAWANESALLWRSANQLRERAEAKRLEAPNYIEIDDNGRRTTLLTHGLAFHRRTDLRMLDTLLIVHGERARSFELGIGVNVTYPLQESLAQLAPLPVLPLTAPPLAGPSSGWLFHLDSRNLLVTSWAVWEESGRVVGVRLRILETSGRSVRAKLRACRALTSAQRCDFLEQSTGALPVEQGAVLLDVGAHQWIEVAARWDALPAEQ